MASTGDDKKTTVLVLADYVGVYYLEAAKTLYVIAPGRCFGGTTDIHIEKEPSPGGLRFVIRGELVHVPGYQPYSTQDIVKDITIPSIVHPSKSIVVVDAEHRPL
jgi:hypothetical protein